MIRNFRRNGIYDFDIRGQDYDGASSMSSERVGVQARIRREARKALYTHCSSHALNLVIAHSCSFPFVRNVLGNVKETFLFFSVSPKREALLKDIVEKSNLNLSNSRSVLLELCKTRWAERLDSYMHFYPAFCYIVKTLEVVAFGLHDDEGFDSLLAEKGQWDRKSKTRATYILKSLCDFSFILTFLTVYKLLSRLDGVTVSLKREESAII